LKGSDFLQFDFSRFEKIAASVYNQGNPYTLPECLTVFRWYFQTYEEYMGHPHPPIRASQIARIMQDMPWIIEEDKGGYYPDIPIELYHDLIRLHFKTKYRRCDYNINHFFTGRIRELRFHELGAGYE